jgi:phosphotransferase family enzyme
MSAPNQFGHDLFRILLYRKNGDELLLEQHDQGFALPSILVPRYTRVAQHIAEAIRREWNFQTVCLFPIGDRTSPTYVVELCDEISTPPTDRRWLPASSLVGSEFRAEYDFHLIELATKRFEHYLQDKAAGPFARIGWIRDLISWIEASATPFGLHLIGRFQQFNAGSTFSLVRFETDGPALWFKAVGEPNLREYAITLAIANYFSPFVPQIITTRKDWNGWLAIEAEGAHPNEQSPHDTWKRIASTLAELQIASSGQTLHLLNVGCRDVRPCSLRTLAAPFVEAMSELMERQTKVSPPPLSRSELLALQVQIEDALSEVEISDIPSAIGHLDFNPGNIVVNYDGCTFLDWAEACAGTPFITLQYLLEYLDRHFEYASKSIVTRAYLRVWGRFLSPAKIAAAQRLSPLLAAFAFAVQTNTWRDSEQTSRTETARYLRSVTRRMKREADRLVRRQA